VISLAIIALVTKYVNGIELPAAKMARMDSALTTVWSDPNDSTRVKALIDLSDHANSLKLQMHLVGRLVKLVGDNHRLQTNPSCPNLKKPLKDVEKNALAIIARLGTALSQSRRRLLWFYQAAPRDLADSLHFNSLDLSFAHFDSTNLRGANFSNSCLFRTSFEGAILDSTDFTLAHLDTSNFRGAQMRGAQLLSINSRGGTFRDAVLSSATLNSARLFSVSFEGADLTCAYFANAVTDHLDMSGAVMPWALLVADTLARVQSWREIINQRGTYLVGVVGLTPRETAFSRDKGAYVDGLDQEQWARLRDQNCQSRPKEKGSP
jgi:uncharacterized protein YjbI with pentapeptide repeats